MNTKAEPNSQKVTKDHKSNQYSKQTSGNLMDNILSNMKSLKTHIKKAHQTSSHDKPVPPNLEPEYLNNILIDLNYVNKFKNKNKNIADKSPAKIENPVSQESKSAHKPSYINSIFGNNDSKKQPKTSINKRLKKLIEYKKHSAKDDDHKRSTSAHSSKQNKVTVQHTKEETSNNVQESLNPEQSIINNKPTSIAECNKRGSKHKKSKKESKKSETKDKINIKSPQTSEDILESYKKIVKSKQNNNKNKSQQKKSNTNCPQTALAKTTNQTQSQQSRKIKLIVNQIASNLHKTSCMELNTGNIKRDIYIKGLSTCMTSQALDQINRILNPPRIAAYKANIAAAKNILLKSNQVPSLTLQEQTPKPVTAPKLRNPLSKTNIANEINTFNRQPQSMPTLENDLELKPKDTTTEKEKPTFISANPIVTPAVATVNEKVQTPVPTEVRLPIIPTIPLESEEQELIKKINEKIEKIINTGLNSFDKIDDTSSSENSSVVEKPPIVPPPPVEPVKTTLAKTREPVRFMQGPIIKPTTPTLKVAPVVLITSKPTNESRAESRASESRANESPPTIQDQPNITNILNVVRNSEIVNNIKQNTITILQNAVSKSVQQASLVEKSKEIEKKSTHEQTKPANNEQDSVKAQPTTKPVPMFKKLQASSENLTKPTIKSGQTIPPTKPHLPTRKSSKTIAPNSATSTTVAIGSNRSGVVSSHFYKNNTNLNNNRTSSSSTLNLIAALSSNKKISFISPMEIVQDFVNLVNHAKRNKKTYTICGNFYSLRRAFAERGWVEKMRINLMEDRETWRHIESLSNFELVDGMKNKDFGEKYRRVFLTKLLAGHQVDFYWDYLTNPFAVNNDKVKRTLINRFPYGATRAYTSKYGLTESLRDAHWYCIDGYANIFYPRTYNLSMNEEMSSFVEDFRLTAVISLLQWIVSNLTTPEKILSVSGDVPTSVFNFATIQCHNFIKAKEHRDIDEFIPQAKDYEWDVFLEKFYRIVHNENCFKTNERISAELMIEQSKYVLKKVKKYLPKLHLDGFKNMWLLKPNNGSRGCGIHVCRTLKYMMDTVSNKKDIKYVVQKYLERPLLIHKTKFDIRQWFLVTCMPNIKVWLYKECYLRFSSQIFDLNKLHESIHLTNNSIQCRYKNNNQRSTSLPEQNMWDSETFKKYLIEIGQPYVWRNNIYKGMKECLIALFMLCQSKMELRINSFELCGADFMLSEDYHPYLIEINSRPALYSSTKITARMCPKVLEDVIKGLCIS